MPTGFLLSSLPSGSCALSVNHQSSVAANDVDWRLQCADCKVAGGSAFGYGAHTA